MATVVVAIGATGALQTSGAIPSAFTASTNAIDSDGATDWATTDTVMVIAHD